jgi:predicted methyltransferase
VSKYTGPLLTSQIHKALLAARDTGIATIECSMDLGRSTSGVEVGVEGWTYRGHLYPFADVCKERTIYYWSDDRFQVAARYTTSLIKLVPTEWGAPTFEIDGIKMLPTAQISPYVDAERKVGLIQPQGKVILDTCGGLGYFAACCLAGHARRVMSYEKNPDVIWLRKLNPWSPDHSDSSTAESTLALTNGDIAEHIAAFPDQSVDAILHDPPRFGIAGELYSQAFYAQLARVLKFGGKLFHYVGTPNKLTSRRDVPNEVANRLRNAGFATEMNGDGVLAARRR